MHIHGLSAHADRSERRKVHYGLADEGVAPHTLANTNVCIRFMDEGAARDTLANTNVCIRLIVANTSICMLRNCSSLIFVLHTLRNAVDLDRCGVYDSCLRCYVLGVVNPHFKLSLLMHFERCVSGLPYKLQRK